MTEAEIGETQRRQRLIVMITTEALSTEAPTQDRLASTTISTALAPQADRQRDPGDDQCIGAQNRPNAIYERRALPIAAEHVPVHKIKFVLDLLRPTH